MRISIGRRTTEASMDEIMEALQKHRPEKPELISDGDFNGVPVYDEWRCPSCSTAYEMEYQEHRFCPHCGQHIDWEE